ncbi:MAG: amino acid ABC transporter substrate-binding protein [Pseudomonadota bacterium]
MTRFPRRNILAAAGAAACALALHGQALAQAAPAANPIKIGFSIALTGGYGGFGKSALLARQIWQEDVNARGGILGRPVQLVYYDDQTSPANVPSIYSKLMFVDKVDLLLGPFGAILQRPIMPLVQQQDRLVFANFAFGTNDEAKYDKFFEAAPFGHGVGAYSGAFVKLAHQQGLKNLAVISADTEATQQLAVGAKEIAAGLGMKVVYDQKYPANLVDFSSILRTIQSTKPDAVLVVSLPVESAALVRSVNELGVGSGVKLFGGAIIGPQLAPQLEALGSQLNGMVTYQVYVPEKSMAAPGVAEFFAKYTPRAKQAQVDPLGFYLAPTNYAMGQVLEQAITATKTTDNKVLAKYMHQAEFSTVAGKISFDGHGYWAKPRMVQVQFQGLVDKNLEQFRQPGKQVIVWPPELATGTLRTPFEAARK